MLGARLHIKVCFRSLLLLRNAQILGEKKKIPPIDIYIVILTLIVPLFLFTHNVCEPLMFFNRDRLS